MRFLLTLALLATGCSFYAPSITDCTVACGEGGACPDGFACRGGWCRVPWMLPAISIAARLSARVAPRR